MSQEWYVVLLNDLYTNCADTEDPQGFLLTARIGRFCEDNFIRTNVEAMCKLSVSVSATLRITSEECAHSDEFFA